MYELDLLNDTYKAISGNAGINVSESSTPTVGAKQNIREVYEKNTDPFSRENMLLFVDLSTLNERMRNVNTITTEFQSAKGKMAQSLLYRFRQDSDRRCGACFISCGGHLRGEAGQR